MLTDESVELMHQAGQDATSFKGQKLKANEGVAGTISDNGDPICVSDPNDERLALRNKDANEANVFSLVAAPILEKSALVGVVEAVNKPAATPVYAHALFTFSNLSETASTRVSSKLISAPTTPPQIRKTPRSTPLP